MTSSRLRERRTSSFYIACILMCYVINTANSFSFLSPFLQRPPKLLFRNDKKHSNVKKGTNSQQPISAIISAEEKQVASVIASSIIRESQTQLNHQSVPTKLNVNIREASYADLLSVSSLRVNVFYPELVTNGAFHTRILEKLRYRKNDGAVCLVALESESPDDCNQPSPTGFHYEHVLGTVEFSPTDFKNTSMEGIGDYRKLYAMDLAIRKSARRYGLATRLLHSIEIYAANHDYHEVYLHVELENEAARYLYRKCGYVEIDLSSNEWAREFTRKRLHKPPESYVFLYKRLSPLSQREILDRQSQVLSHLITTTSSHYSSSPSPASSSSSSSSLSSVPMRA